MDLEMKETFDEVEYENEENPRYECMENILDGKYYNQNNQIKLDGEDKTLDDKPVECYLEPINPGDYHVDPINPEDYRVKCVRTPIRHVRSSSSENSENAIIQTDSSYTPDISGRCVLTFTVISFLVVIAAFVCTLFVLRSYRDEEVNTLQRRLSELELRLMNTTSSVQGVQQSIYDLQQSTTSVQNALVSKVNEVQNTTVSPPVAVNRTHTAFRATLSAPVTPGTSGKVIFGNTTLNDGGAYNTSTGIFTCPVEGYYVFAFSIVSYNGYFSAQLLVNNMWRQFAVSDSTAGHHASSTAVTVTKLKPKDRVWIGVEIKGAGSTLHEYESFFSGWNL